VTLVMLLLPEQMDPVGQHYSLIKNQ